MKRKHHPKNAKTTRKPGQRGPAARTSAGRVLDESALASVAGGSNPLATVEAMGKVAMKSLVINGGALAGAGSTILEAGAALGSKSGQGSGGTVPL